MKKFERDLLKKESGENFWKFLKTKNINQKGLHVLGEKVMFFRQKSNFLKRKRKKRPDHIYFLKFEVLNAYNIFQGNEGNENKAL